MRDLPEHNRLRRESSERALRQAKEFAVDLVQVSIHSGACPKCLRVQGKLFSITGNTPGFPVLTEDVTPPICEEECAHVLLAAPLAFLAARGTLGFLQAFSNDNGHVVTDAYDYADLVAGRSPGHELAEGERIAEEYRASHPGRRPRAKGR
jgi:hypothetical protein